MIPDVLADEARTLGIETPARNKELHGHGVVAAAGRDRSIEPVRVVDAGHVAFNAETGLAALAEGALTATNAFYVRGHGAVPQLDPAAWRLQVHGLVERPTVAARATGAIFFWVEAATSIAAPPVPYGGY